MTWIGYKVHLTETCDPDRPHLITHVETTPAVTADVDHDADAIHAALAAKGLLPGEHLVDAGYVDAELLVGSQLEHGVRPGRPGAARRELAGAGEQGLRHRAASRSTGRRRRVTCPEGKTSISWKPGHDRGATR